MSTLIHDPTAATAENINRLYAEATRLSKESSQALHAALVAAWEAGHLLIAEKKRVRRLMGPGAWLLWVEQNFQGTPRTAQRYMLLAKSVSDVTFLTGMSLRQAYERLGIATEPKTPVDKAVMPPLPRHVSLANRLLGMLATKGNHAAFNPRRRSAYQQDLRALYERLRALFDDSSG
jgi:hypothetical protein